MSQAKSSAAPALSTATPHLTVRQWFCPPSQKDSNLSPDTETHADAGVTLSLLHKDARE